MTQFSSVVKKSKHRVFYFDIPSQIMNSMELKPFVACKMKAEKKQITLFDFQKTFKIKVELTEHEAELFCNLFRKYQDLWTQVKELKPGSLTLHFDKDFNIKKHEFHFYQQTKI